MGYNCKMKLHLVCDGLIIHGNIRNAKQQKSKVPNGIMSLNIVRSFSAMSSCLRRLQQIAEAS